MKAEPDDFLQLVQWQSTVVEGAPEIVYVIKPQRQEPLVTSVAPAFEAGFARSSAAILKRCMIKWYGNFEKWT